MFTTNYWGFLTNYTINNIDNSRSSPSPKIILVGTYLIQNLTASFLIVFSFGDAAPVSASVSPLDDITLPGHGHSGHHSPAVFTYIVEPHLNQFA